MDLEKLTKHQTVLLTLLVSFVTSIATGIVTVGLLYFRAYQEHFRAEVDRLAKERKA